MNVTYLTQDDRFQVRIQPEAVGLYPPGSFGATVNVPVYALRVDGDGEGSRSYFLIPSGDGLFLWVPMEQCRLARR
jgi:hypothetical protein